MENSGGSRTLGRSFGYLLLADKPRTLDQIASDLRYSKATASLTMRQGLTMRIFEKSSLPGERKTLYRANAHCWINATLAKAEDIKQWENIIDMGLDFLQGDNGTARENLLVLKDYFNFINWYLSDISVQYQRWQRGEVDKTCKKTRQD